MALGSIMAGVPGPVEPGVPISWAAVLINIIAPGKENEAMFVGSSSGNQFEGRLPASGDYKVRVYLMRSAARRDEIANYHLEMVID